MCVFNAPATTFCHICVVRRKTKLISIYLHFVETTSMMGFAPQPFWSLRSASTDTLKLLQSAHYEKPFERHTQWEARRPSASGQHGLRYNTLSQICVFDVFRISCSRAQGKDFPLVAGFLPFLCLERSYLNEIVRWCTAASSTAEVVFQTKRNVEL